MTCPHSKLHIMTKLEIINKITQTTKFNKYEVSKTIEAFMTAVKDSLKHGENVYLRGFGTFHIKHRAEKSARIISENISIIIPAHNKPNFKPNKTFVNNVKMVANKD